MRCLLPFNLCPAKRLTKEVRLARIAAQLLKLSALCNSNRNIKAREMNLSIGNGILEGAETLRAADISEGRREAGSLLAHVVGRDRSFMITHADELLTSEQTQTFRSFIARRAKGEPLQYIIGHQEFFKLDFEVTPDVLIPRPETELIVEIALELLKDESEPFIGDIGTGSGCVAISLLHEMGEARGFATDISAAALRVARLNAERHGVSNRLRLIESDCFAAVDRSSQFSLIASNPPYIGQAEWKNLPREVRDHEPRSALVSGPDGLADIRRLIDEAPSFLHSHGYFVFEIGFDQSKWVEQLIDSRKWKLVEIRRDLQNIPRTVVLQKN